MLDGAFFDRARLDMADFSRASLRGASFRDATLSDASFFSADVWKADFAGAVGLDRTLYFDPSEALNADWGGSGLSSTIAIPGQGARSQSYSYSRTVQCSIDETPYEMAGV